MPSKSWRLGVDTTTKNGHTAQSEISARSCSLNQKAIPARQSDQSRKNLGPGGPRLGASAITPRTPRKAGGNLGLRSLYIRHLSCELSVISGLGGRFVPALSDRHRFGQTCCVAFLVIPVLASWNRTFAANSNKGNSGPKLVFSVGAANGNFVSHSRHR